jgi:hypothetical protein
MWPLKKRKFSQLIINAFKKKTNIKNIGDFADVEFWLGGPKTSDQMLEERELLKPLLFNPLFNIRHPKLEGAALVFKISYDEKVCEVVIEIRPPGGLIYVLEDQKVTKEGRIMVYFQNIDDKPLKFEILPEFILTGNLLLPWKAGITKIFSPHNNSFGEVIMWQTTYNDLAEIELLPSEIVIIIERCEVIMEQFTNNIK